jgi:translation initiation factor 4E
MRRGKANTKPVDEQFNPNAAESKESETTGTNAAAAPYENSIKSITTVKTVQEFWATYNYLRRPNDLSSTTDYHFFRDGIKPTWEDPKNSKGGKWILRLPKGLASRYWEEVILAIIGGQFPDSEVCGAVISIRYSEDILALWNKNASDREMVERLREALKKTLQLPPHAAASLEYKPHQNAIADRSSFRNTQTWKPTRQSVAEGRETRRTGSWGERENKPNSRRDSDRAWR